MERERTSGRRKREMGRQEKEQREIDRAEKGLRGDG